MANILVFDSGVGGLTIYREIRSMLPAHNYVYLFDNANFPYGELSEATLITVVTELLTHMVALHHIDLVVIACNTASTIALPTLRNTMTIPVVGVVPAIKPAAALTQNNCIALLATPGTISRDYTHQLIREFAPHLQVLLKGSTQLVIEAERKLRGEAVNMAYLHELVAEWIEGEVRPDTIVLGCTHFPLLNEEIQQLMPHCRLVDSSSAVANRVRTLLMDGNNNQVANRELTIPPIAKVFCSRRDREAEKLIAPLKEWGLLSLEEV